MAINLINRLSVLATVIVATLPGVVVQAQTTMPMPTETTPTTPATGTTTPMRRTSVKKTIKLTPQQRQEMQAVMAKRNSDIEAVLDSNQKTQLTNAMHSGQRFSRALAALTLKPDQQTQITSIKAAASQKMREIMSGSASSTAPSNTLPTAAPLNTLPSSAAPLNTAPSNSMPSQPMQH